METIECKTLFGRKKSISTNTLKFRPAVYGVVIHNDNLLTVFSRNANKLMLPGGGIDIGETIETALKREIKEETGVTISIISFLKFQEDFFYYDPTKSAYHGFLFYYHCFPKTFDLLSSSQVDDLEATLPQWYPIEKLQPEDFQSHGQFILELIESIQANNSTKN